MLKKILDFIFGGLIKTNVSSKNLKGTNQLFYDHVKADLIEDEGYKLKLYECPAGKLTIGIGYNIQDNGISDAIAEALFKEKYIECYTALLRIFPNFESYTWNRRKALINMIYQLGETKFRKFSNTINYIKAEAFDLASAEMLDSMWAKQTPNRAKKIAGMIKRG